MSSGFSRGKKRIQALPSKSPFILRSISNLTRKFKRWAIGQCETDFNTSEPTPKLSKAALVRGSAFRALLRFLCCWILFEKNGCGRGLCVCCVSCMCVCVTMCCVRRHQLIKSRLCPRRSLVERWSARQHSASLLWCAHATIRKDLVPRILPLSGCHESHVRWAIHAWSVLIAICLVLADDLLHLNQHEQLQSSRRVTRCFLL